MSSADGMLPGVTPDGGEPEWIGYRLIIVSVVFLVMSLVFLVPRLYSAAFIIKKWHTDDCKLRWPAALDGGRLG
jgi:hypothetical protein